MKLYTVEATDFSPEVILDQKKNTFEISGISRPENANEFYEPIVIWLDEYVKNPNKRTEFKFRFDYIQSVRK